MCGGTKVAAIGGHITTWPSLVNRFMTYQKTWEELGNKTHGYVMFMRS